MKLPTRKEINRRIAVLPYYQFLNKLTKEEVVAFRQLVAQPKSKQALYWACTYWLEHKANREQLKKEFVDPIVEGLNATQAAAMSAVREHIGPLIFRSSFALVKGVGRRIKNRQRRLRAVK